MKRNLLIGSSIAALVAGTMMAGAQGMQQKSGGAERGLQGQGQTQQQEAPQGKQQETPQGKQQRPRQGAREKGGQTTGQGQREEGKQEGQPQSKQQGQREEGKGTQSKQQGQRQNNEGSKSGNREGTQTRTEGKGNVNITEEQRTHLRQTAIQHGPRATNINVSINVGTVIPTTVRVVTVTPEIIEIYPDYRGYLYFVYEDEIIIVDRGHKIVAVIAV